MTQSTVSTDSSNEIVLGEQRGTANIASLSQTGGPGNKVQSIRQDNSSSAAGGNLATLTIVGSDNGALGLGTITGPDFAASVAGAFDKSIVQTGGGNSVVLAITGSRNQFGFNQVGDSNDALGLAITVTTTNSA